MNDLRPSGRPGPERPNFSKTAGCKKPYKILCKIAPQTRFRASGSPGTVFEVPGAVPEAPEGDSDETVSYSRETQLGVQ